MRGIKKILTPAEERWLAAHFKHTRNEECAERLGMSVRAVIRLARSTGLAKSRQFMRKTQAVAAANAKASHLKHGTYPPKGYQIPNREKGAFRKGETSLQRIGARRERERIERSAATRREVFREEKARAVFGVPRKTRLRVVALPRHVSLQRHYLRKLGYIIAYGSFTAYYTPETRRSARYESRTRQSCPRYVHFEFKPMEEMAV